MKTQFDLLKNGKVATTVWANKETKEIVVANRNCFGWNMLRGFDKEFDTLYGNDMKINQCKGNYRGFSYSAKSMEEKGFNLIMRGADPLWK